MDNSAIRKRAWALHKQHMRGMVVIGLAVILATMARMWVSNQFSVYSTNILMPASAPEVDITIVALHEVAQLVFQLILSLVTWPILSIGLFYVNLEVWEGKAPRFSDLFVYVRNRYGRAVVLCMVWSLITSVQSIVTTITTLLAGAFDLPQLILLYVAGLLASIAGVVLSLRMTLVGYFFAKDPDKPITWYIKNSWRQMRKKCGDAFALQISVMWIYILPLGLAAVFSKNFTMFNLTSSAIAVGCLAVSTCFFGYSYIALAGFASERLREFESGGEAQSDASA